MNDVDWTARAADYIQAHHVMSMATYGSNGIWSAALFYVADQFTFYFLSAPHTRHATDVMTNKQVAVTIQDSDAEWERIRGIQLSGAVHLLAGEEADEAKRRYIERHSFLRTADDALLNRLNQVNWYQLIPNQLYYIDNESKFGFRVQII